MPAAGPHVWAGPALSPRETMLPVGAEETAEAASGTPGPALSARLRQAAEACAEGIGFALLRGLPPEGLDGHLASFAAVLGTPSGPAETGRVPPCDLALVAAPVSGRAALVSAGAVHNALLAQDPALAAELHAGDAPGGVFAAQAGMFAALLPAAMPGGPAGAALAAAVEDPSLRLALELRAGDVLLLDPFRVWAVQVPPEARALPISTGPRLAEPPFSRLLG
jgi:hypothetical protein